MGINFHWGTGGWGVGGEGHDNSETVFQKGGVQLTVKY